MSSLSLFFKQFLIERCNYITKCGYCHKVVCRLSVKLVYCDKTAEAIDHAIFRGRESIAYLFEFVDRTPGATRYNVIVSIISLLLIYAAICAIIKS